MIAVSNKKHPCARVFRNPHSKLKAKKSALSLGISGNVSAISPVCSGIQVVPYLEDTILDVATLLKEVTSTPTHDDINYFLWLRDSGLSSLEDQLLHPFARKTVLYTPLDSYDKKYIEKVGTLCRYRNERSRKHRERVEKSHTPKSSSRLRLLNKEPAAHLSYVPKEKVEGWNSSRPPTYSQLLQKVERNRLSKDCDGRTPLDDRYLLTWYEKYLNAYYNIHKYIITHPPASPESQEMLTKSRAYHRERIKNASDTPWDLTPNFSSTSANDSGGSDQEIKELERQAHQRGYEEAVLDLEQDESASADAYQAGYKQAMLEMSQQGVVEEGRLPTHHTKAYWMDREGHCETKSVLKRVKGETGTNLPAVASVAYTASEELVEAQAKFTSMKYLPDNERYDRWFDSKCVIAEDSLQYLGKRHSTGSCPQTVKLERWLLKHSITPAIYKQVKTDSVFNTHFWKWQSGQITYPTFLSLTTATPRATSSANAKAFNEWAKGLLPATSKPQEEEYVPNFVLVKDIEFEELSLQEYNRLTMERYGVTTREFEELPRLVEDPCTAHVQAYEEDVEVVDQIRNRLTEYVEECKKDKVYDKFLSKVIDKPSLITTKHKASIIRPDFNRNTTSLDIEVINLIQQVETGRINKHDLRRRAFIAFEREYLMPLVSSTLV